MRPELAEQIVEFIVKNTSTRTIGSGGELFNPYLASEHAPKTQDDPRYLEANIPGIMRKLEEFTAIENDTEMAASMGLLKEALPGGAKPAFDLKEAIDTLIRAAGSWEPEHLFPGKNYLTLPSNDFSL